MISWAWGRKSMGKTRSNRSGSSFHPASVTGRHVRRVPAQLLAAGQQLGSMGERVDEPLLAGDDLEWPVAVLVELDRVGDRLGLADQVARLAEQFDDASLGLLDG